MTELHGPRGAAAGGSERAVRSAVSPGEAVAGRTEATTSGVHVVGPASSASRQALTIDAVLDGRLGMDDVRLDPAVLLHQAELAEADGNPQLGANLRRAAELVGLPDAEVLRIYEALRPSRSSAGELEQIASSLDERGAVMNAALIREAAAAYVRRGLVRR